MRIVIVVTDGVGVRNFVHGRFLNVLKQKHEVHIFCGISVSTLQKLAPQTIADCSLHEMTHYKEAGAANFLRRTAERAHLKFYDTYGMRYNRLRDIPEGWSIGAIKKRTIHHIAYRFASKRGIAVLNSLHEKAVQKNKLYTVYKNKLTSIAPELVFFTHQRPPQLAPIAVAAKQLNIPTVAFIFSWDNLSSKGRIPVLFDHYLVWSKLMEEELLRFYPNTQPQNVHIVGTPQFETYKYDEFGLTMSEFKKQLTGNIPDNYKIICFSCGDITTSPNDEQYITVIAEAIVTKKIKDSVLVVRTSPAESDQRFRKVKEKYPNIIWNVPDWYFDGQNHPEPWSQRTPTINDINFLKALITYSDVSINMCSTMSLDFAITGKPVINPLFGDDNIYKTWFHDQIFTKFEHYKYVINSGAVIVAENECQLINTVNEAIVSPKQRHQQQQAILNLEISCPITGTSERIIETFEKIVACY